MSHIEFLEPRLNVTTRCDGCSDEVYEVQCTVLTNVIALCRKCNPPKAWLREERHVQMDEVDQRI